MDYTDLNRKMTLPLRQASLFAIISAAQMAAHESGTTIYIIHSPFYVDEHIDSQHVYATKEAAALIYPKRAGVPWSIDAAVEPDGSVFLNQTEDALLVLENTTKEQRRVTVELCGQAELPLS